MEPVEDQALGLDGWLGLEAEPCAELAPVEGVVQVFVGGLQQPEGGAEDRLRVAGLGRLEWGPAAECRLGRRRPDFIDDVGPLLAVEPLDVFLRDALGHAPPPAHRELMPRLLLDHLGAGV